MSDLISRNEVVKLVNQFVFGLCKEQNDEVRRTFNKYIEKMQIAYDVDKVVNELEEVKMRYFLTIANTGDEKSDFAYENVGNVLDKAIKIVKHGGVSDDVCEWKRDEHSENDNPAEWIICPHKPKRIFSKDIKYCPYCGKKIKVVE